MAPENFDFEKWAREYKLSRKTCTALHTAECDTHDSLKLATSQDVNRMDIAPGQSRLVRLALQALGNPILLDDRQGSAAGPRQPDKAGVNVGTQAADEERNNQALRIAGEDLAQLLGEREADSNDQGAHAGLPVQSPLHTSNGYEVKGYCDPLMLLTVKATTSKALQIVNFLPESVKNKVNRKRREQFTIATSAEGKVSLRAEESGSYYVTLDEWSGANMRLAAHLLKTGEIQQSDLVYYMAYTALVSDLAGKYEWSSVLEFDTRYRELQAEHGFVWGTQHPHMERHVLVPKRVMMVKAGNTGNAGGNSGREMSTQLCKLYLAKGWCKFGRYCKYRHENATAAEQGNPEPKNE